MKKGICEICEKERRLNKDNICRTCQKELNDFVGILELVFTGFTMLDTINKVGKWQEQVVKILQGKEEE
jgi:hypothetical protein